MPRDTGERISVLRDRSGENPCADVRVDETPPTHSTLGDVPERWSRCHHVALLRQLATAKPSVIAVDVTFRPRQDLARTEDRALGEAIHDAGKVVVAQKFKVRLGAEALTTQDSPAELTHEVANAALGVAPMPLPALPSNRFDQFWTFKEAGWAAPSLPALALQAYAVDAYPALLSALQRVAPEAVTGLPHDADELIHDRQLQAHMLQIRSLFLNLPASMRSADTLLSASGGELSEPQTRNLHALLALYTGESARYLNLYGPPGTIRTIHIADVLSAPHHDTKADPLGLRGKVVFVGYADAAEWEQLEKFPTVYGSGSNQASGVELVATAFANLLEDVTPVPASAYAQFLIAFALAFIAAVVCYTTATATGSVTVLLAGCAYLGVSVLLFSRTAFCLPVFVPLAVAMPLGLAYGPGYKLVHYKLDRATLRYILNQFVPPEIVDSLARNARQLGRVKESTNVACVMTDVEGFTTLSTTLAPAQLANLLSEYFEAIFKPIAELGGFVSDLKGDSILAIWTDRDCDPRVRERVCEAALELRRVVDRFNDAHPQSPLPTRIGVHYGPVVLGAVGAVPHFEYRAVGDTVNTASRVEQLSKDLGTRLLVTLPMLEGLQGFLARDLGAFPLRGRRTATQIFELIARTEDARPEQLHLCSRFAEAKEAYENAELERARAGFQSILHGFPKDGPSGYFLRLIEGQA